MTERMNKNEPPKYWRNPFKGEKNAIKSFARYRTRVWLKSNERIWLRTSVADKSWATWLCKLYLRTAAAETRSPTFRFTFTYITCILFIFSSDFLPLRSFCSVLKSRGTIPISARLIRREQFPCTRLLSLVIIHIFLYLLSFLFFNTLNS